MDGIEVRNLLRARPPLVEPSEPVYEIEITGESEAHKKNGEACNQEERNSWENHVIKAWEKRVLCNSYKWVEADAKVRSYLFSCLGAEGHRQVQQKRPSLELHNVTTRTHDNTGRHFCNFICRKQKKSENLEQFHADLVELASQADCGEREDEWVRDIFTAHVNMERSQKNY